MDYLLTGLILILLLIIFFQQRDIFMTMKKKYEDLRQATTDDLAAYLGEAQEYQETIAQQEQTIQELSKQQKSINQQIFYYKNRRVQEGEKVAEKDLRDIFDQFKQNGKIDDYYLANDLLFVDDNTVRQVDHLLISSRGAFLMETKTWQGDIFYNVSKTYLENNGYGLLTRYLFNPLFKQSKDFCTFVIRPNRPDEKDDAIRIQDYNHPFNQVMTTLNHVQPMLKGNVYLNAVIYFNYKNTDAGYLFEDGSAPTSKVKAVDTKEKLQNYFAKMIEENTAKNFEIDPDKIKQIQKQLADNVVHS